MGVLKALVGLMGRPMVGALEGTSKLFHSLALASLGREGILGKMQRRVKAPGAFAEVGAEQAEEEPRREAEAQMRQLMAAWQRVLPEFFPGMAGDTVSGERGGPGACAAQTEETAACRAWRARVLLCCCCSHGCPPALTLPIRPLTHPTTTYPHPPPPPPPKHTDVINVRASRVVLITDHHIAYLRARHQSHQSIYKAKWLVPISEIQNLSGELARGSGCRPGSCQPGRAGQGSAWRPAPGVLPT